MKPEKITKKSPYCAEWASIDEDGQPVLRELYVDDLLQDVADGYTVFGLMTKHDASREIVEHVLMYIPYLMAWRTKEAEEATPSQDADYMALPKL